MAIDPDLDYPTGEPRNPHPTAVVVQQPRVVQLSKHVLIRSDSPYYANLSELWAKARIKGNSGSLEYLGWQSVCHDNKGACP